MIFKGGNFGMKKKIIGLFVCMLLVGTVLPVTGNVLIDKTPLSSTNGKTLYVGGSGPGNYKKIQDAIDNASDGDTVFVYNGTYNEYLIINNRINLIGENPHNTIVNSKISPVVIDINSDKVKVQGFTISAKGNMWLSVFGIRISSSYCKISFCKLMYISWKGIMFIDSSNHNYIYRNTFQNLSEGISIENPLSCANTIKQNNFISIKPAFEISLHNNWIMNYFDNWIGIGPKIIWGQCNSFPWFNLDRYPSRAPIDIYYKLHINRFQLLN